MIKYDFLGQSSIKFQIFDLVIYIDPYLSNSVEKLEGEAFKRQVPIYLQPDQIQDANFVLITHIHLDHCDLDTLIPIYLTSKSCKFIAPNIVCNYLIINGFDKNRLVCINNESLSLGNNIRIHPIPAAHPCVKYDKDGFIECVGYIFEICNKNLIYHSGDTFLCDEIINELNKFIPIKMVLLPVNEHNYFKEKEGIIGNMSLREAFGFAKLLKAERFKPIHWDMFKNNSISAEEIKICYSSLDLPFELDMNYNNILNN